MVSSGRWQMAVSISAMMFFSGIIDGFGANLEPFSRRDHSSGESGLLERFMTQLLLSMLQVDFKFAFVEDHSYSSRNLAIFNIFSQRTFKFYHDSSWQRSFNFSLNSCCLLFNEMQFQKFMLSIDKENNYENLVLKMTLTLDITPQVQNFKILRFENHYVATSLSLAH